MRREIIKIRFKGILVLTVVLFLAFTVQVFAHHDYSPGRHLISQHSSTTDLYCVDVESSNISWSTAADNLSDVLRDLNDGWMLATNGYKLDFMRPDAADNTNCSDIPSNELEDISIRYYLMTNTSGTPCGGANCIAVRGGQTLTHMESDGRATDYQYAKIIFRDYSFNVVTNYIINHETGHAIGLIDGDGTCPITEEEFGKEEFLQQLKYVLGLDILEFDIKKKKQ